MTSLPSGNETGRHSAPDHLGAADPNLPFTVTLSRHGDAEFTVGHDDTAVLTLILSEGQ